MKVHLQCFADLLKAVEDKKAAQQTHAKAITRRILAICDRSDDVPGDIAALISAELEAAGGRRYGQP